MWGFTGKDSIEQRQEVAATRKMIGFLLGIGMFAMAFLWFIPKDLFTTAAWLDGKGLGLLYSGGATAFQTGSFWDITDVTVPVSEEAFRFAAMITLLQLAFGYLIGVSGSYISGQDCENTLQFFYLATSGKVNARNVNWRKLGFWFTFIGIACFDTYTDWQFASRNGQPDLIIVSLLYSLLIYNIASEFALIMGLQLAIGNAPDAISGALTTMMGILTSPFKSKVKPQHGGGQPKQGGSQQPQQPGGGKKQQPGGQPKQGGQQHNPQQPQRQHQPMRPVSREQNGGSRASLPEYRMEPLDLDNL